MIHKVGLISFLHDVMQIKIDGNIYSFEIKSVSEKLAKASSKERENYTVSPSGYGINWPLIDEDLSIDGLLGVQHEWPERRKTA